MARLIQIKKHLGSTIALIIGVLLIISDLVRPGNSLIAGFIIVIGTIAYRSAKKRKLNEVKNSLLRRSLERLGIVIIAAAILLQKDLKIQIATDPITNVIIPLWAIIAYLIITWKKSDENSN